MTINEMIQKRAKVWDAAKSFVDTHENENGVLSAEDNETYSRMEKEIEDLTNAIDRQQRAEAREAEFSKPVNTPITERPVKQVEEKTGRASNAYKEDFGAHLRGKRLVHNVLSEGVQADGGYLVPEEFERQIVTGLDEANVVRGLAKVITTSAERKIPVAAAGALTVAFGDFKNYWIADRSGRTVQRLNELYSTNGQVGFVATERVDGKVILPEGIQLLKMKAGSGN